MTERRKSAKQGRTIETQTSRRPTVVLKPIPDPPEQPIIPSVPKKIEQKQETPKFNLNLHLDINKKHKKGQIDSSEERRREKERANHFPSADILLGHVNRVDNLHKNVIQTVKDFAVETAERRRLKRNARARGEDVSSDSIVSNSEKPNKMGIWGMSKESIDKDQKAEVEEVKKKKTGLNLGQMMRQHLNEKVVEETKRGDKQMDRLKNGVEELPEEYQRHFEIPSEDVSDARRYLNIDSPQSQQTPVNPISSPIGRTRNETLPKQKTSRSRNINNPGSIDSKSGKVVSFRDDMIEQNL